ncbi:hypothetical protein NGM37_48395, partial [Streptomyces sp. TRM76130]|nr:hypothetical protein [Streptomyces sp. TRM76130]
VVRIMRPGRVASARRAAEHGAYAAVPRQAGAPAAEGAAERRHWHVADLLHALHPHRTHRKAG